MIKLLLALFLLADLMTTMVGIGLRIAENNPFYHAAGYDTFIAVKGIGSIAVVLLIKRMDLPPAGLRAVSSLVAAVVLSNALVLARVF